MQNFDHPGADCLIPRTRSLDGGIKLLETGILEVWVGCSVKDVLSINGLHSGIQKDRYEHTGTELSRQYPGAHNICRNSGPWD